mmetsp:Transcript_14593/g.14219  ORF Transcript_14593/g.14219 Transcript_14593/m.14219 type:complete len:100 (-) Transcript_14593:1349-1648(-)
MVVLGNVIDLRFHHLLLDDVLNLQHLPDILLLLLLSQGLHLLDFQVHLFFYPFIIQLEPQVSTIIDSHHSEVIHLLVLEVAESFHNDLFLVIAVLFLKS